MQRWCLRLSLHLSPHSCISKYTIWECRTKLVRHWAAIRGVEVIQNGGKDANPQGNWVTSIIWIEWGTPSAQLRFEDELLHIAACSHTGWIDFDPNWRGFVDQINEEAKQRLTTN